MRHVGPMQLIRPLHTKAPLPAPIRWRARRARKFLTAGGNAFDAAVAVAAALAVVEPSSSGLGGGGFFLLHRQSDGFETMVDAREKAPGAATRDMYLDKAGNETKGFDRRSAIGGNSRRACGIRISGAQIRQAAPEAKLAAGDPPGAGRVSRCMRGCNSASNRNAIFWLRSPDAAKAFLTADGNVPEVGAIIKQPELANTLEAIADQGARGFYEGRVAAESRCGCARGRRHLDARGSEKLPRGRTQTARRRISRRAHRHGIAAVIGRHRGPRFAQYPRRFRFA